MTIYDSVSKTKRPFEPITAGKATLYVCGPTVYDDAHLGHAKSALVFDLLVRVLKANGLDVTFARNITDIDDKIVKKMGELNLSLEELTQTYTKAYHRDMDALGIMRPDIEPKATESIDQMIQLILNLIDKGYAYKTQDGDVYFDTQRDDKYLSISHRIQDQDDTQSRIEANSQKKNPADFALWKHFDEGLRYETVFSAGRPGWHTECAAMINEHLAVEGPYAIDIHGGGADLLFPHHENEAAQHRCSSNQELAKYWMHNGFVNIDGEKMSKSLGNSFFLKDALKSYHGEVLRFYLSATHYRSDFNFNELDLKSSKKRLDKLYRLKKRLFGMKTTEEKTAFQVSLLEALSDDLNMSKGLSLLDEMISKANETLDINPKDKLIKRQSLANMAYVEKLLGFGLQNPFEYFQFGINEELKDTINSLIKKRTEAKKEKDFTRSDAIRDELIALDISIMDTAEGTFWEKN
ncbi:cysteine--tRNA ligase [Sulfurimonas sp. MAG313]|nr:cysteine--tRNA ligase [Sulfurimonas sp. MAG313]MDF1882290.1 cysteine--tRNA ligase [Sulfurimonas sp. MAG313]